MPCRSAVAIVALAGLVALLACGPPSPPLLRRRRRRRRGAIRIFKVCGDTRVRFRWSDPHSSQGARL